MCVVLHIGKYCMDTKQNLHLCLNLFKSNSAGAFARCQCFTAGAYMLKNYRLHMISLKYASQFSYSFACAGLCVCVCVCVCVCLYVCVCVCVCVCVRDILFGRC